MHCIFIFYTTSGLKMRFNRVWFSGIHRNTGVFDPILKKRSQQKMFFHFFFFYVPSHRVKIPVLSIVFPFRSLFFSFPFFHFPFLVSIWFWTPLKRPNAVYLTIVCFWPWNLSLVLLPWLHFQYGCITMLYFCTWEANWDFLSETWESL